MVDELSPQRGAEHDVKPDRRRPGRVAHANPALIRMLRSTYDAAVHELHLAHGDDAKRHVTDEVRSSHRDGPDDLRPARGILSAVIIGAALWAIIGAAVWTLVRIL